MFFLRVLCFLITFSSFGFSMERDAPIEEPLSIAKKTRKIVGLACDSCRKSKVKCDTNYPCGQCAKKNRECHRSGYQKRGPKKRKIETLQRISNNYNADVASVFQDNSFTQMENSNNVSHSSDVNNNNNVSYGSNVSNNNLSNEDEYYIMQSGVYYETIYRSDVLQHTNQNQYEPNFISGNENLSFNDNTSFLTNDIDANSEFQSDLIYSIKPDKKDEFIVHLMKCNQALKMHSKCQAEMQVFLSDRNNFK